MSRSTDLKWKLSLALLLILILACDASSLPFAATPTPAKGPSQFPGPSQLGSAGVYRPSAAGWIAFIDQGNLWLIHPDGSGLKQITQNATPAPTSPNAGFNLRWSPDGKMLGYSVGGVLTVLDIGSLQMAVRANATAGGFDWSGNGEQMVYDGPLTTGESGKPANTGLWVVDVASGRTRQLLPSSAAYPAMLSPLWSFDGTRLIFSEPQGAQPGGAHLLNLSTGAIMDLAARTADATPCTWAPRLLLIACLDANPTAGQSPSLVFLDQDGKENLDVALPAAHFNPRLGPWAPDGKGLSLVYSSDANGSQYATDILSIDTQQFKTLVPGRAVAWSSDGRWIALQGGSADASQTVTIVNTTSGLSSTLPNSAALAWQPGIDSGGGAPTPSFCMDSTVGFVHKKPKGYFLTFCAGAQHYTYPSLEQGAYAVGPQAVYFIYVSNSGYVFAAHMGDAALTRIGEVRNFIAVRTDGIEPKFQIRFLAGYPNIVQVVEQQYGEKETFNLPRRITTP